VSRVLIAHLSDLHITAPGRKAYGKVPTGDNLARCVNHINNLSPQPDIVLVTGDVTFDGTAEETALAGRLLGDLRMPWYVVPGNHDNPDTLKVLQHGWERAPMIRKESRGFDYFLSDFAVSLLGIDSSTPNSPGGKVSNDQAKWIHRCLVENGDKPVILFLHHPPVRCGVLETDEDGFEGADLLGAVVDRFPNIIRVLCGHIHLASHVNWHGTIVSTAPSMGLQLYLDLTMQLPSAFVVEHPGYCLHYYTPARDLVTHTIYVHEPDGPYPF